MGEKMELLEKAHSTLSQGSEAEKKVAQLTAKAEADKKAAATAVNMRFYSVYEVVRGGEMAPGKSGAKMSACVYHVVVQCPVLARRPKLTPLLSPR